MNLISRTHLRGIFSTSGLRILHAFSYSQFSQLKSLNNNQAFQISDKVIEPEITLKLIAKLSGSHEVPHFDPTHNTTKLVEASPI